MKKHLITFCALSEKIMTGIIGTVGGMLIASRAMAQGLGGVQQIPALPPTAQPTVVPGSAPSIQVNSWYDIVTKILCPTFNVMFYVLIGISVIMVIFAAFQYATAGDDTEKTTKGRKTLTWAMVGIAVALLAKALPVLVGNIYGVALSSGC